MGDAEKMHANFESWREQAMRQVKKYGKSKRFKQAKAYWEGYAQACANAKCIAYGYTMAAANDDRPNASVPEKKDV